VSVALCVFAGAVQAASAEGVCDPIVQESDRVTQEQLAFTIKAYEDGQITPEEAAQAEAFGQRIAQITADLAQCLQTGVLPPGYAPQAPIVKPPVANTFEVEIAKWHIGDHALRIFWDTSVPTTVQIKFAQIVKNQKAQTKPVGTLTAPPGVTSIDFNGKVGGHKLKPGKYQLTLTATDEAGNVSDPVTRKLRILPKRK
jgi:hypothetical protein